MSLKQRRQQTTKPTKKSVRRKPALSPLARKATKLYQTKLKALLEPVYIGKFAAIEPDSGDYFVANRMTEAMHEARLKHPDKRFFLVRIGFEAAVSFRNLLVFIIVSCCSGSTDTLFAKQHGSIRNVITQKTEDARIRFSPSKVDNLKKNSLFIFVGEKIDVVDLARKEASQEVIRLDVGFLAKYKVLDKIYGDYSKDIIEFEAYDHYGDPAFSKYKFVLLFVSFHQGKFYHEKYQYFGLYRTKDGKWASPYSAGDYNHEYNKRTAIRPEKIEFAEEIFYDVSKVNKAIIKEWYPAPYYQVIQGRAKAVYGNYILELFKLKRNGILKARELF